MNYLMNLTVNKSLVIVALILATFAPVQASEVKSSFDPETGRLEITNLELDGQIYYLELDLTDAATLSFAVNAASVVDLTPGEAQIGLTAEAIIGSWSIDGEANTSITFNSDGTYTQSQGAGIDLDECPDGGIETGSYSWTPNTGLIRFSVDMDNNGECGLSHSGRSLRFLIDGNTATIQEGNGSGATATRS
jgi:hypothetical protein